MMTNRLVSVDSVTKALPASVQTVLDAHISSAVIPPAVATKVDKAVETVSVKDHGATGDGSTDDTNAFNATRDLTTPGAKIIVPKGTYIVTGITLNKAGQVWELAEGAVLKLQAATSANVVNISGNNVVFIGGKLDGNKSNQTTEFSGLVISASNVLVNRVETTNCYGNGISLASTSIASVVTNCYSHDNGLSTNAANGIYLRYATYSRITGNRCENNGTVGDSTLYDGNGIYMAGGATNCHNIVANNQSNFNARRGVKVQELGASVIGNSCTGNSGAGVGVTVTPNPTSTPVVVSGNSLNNNYVGVQIDNCSFITISGNMISDNTMDGIQANQYGSSLNITGNTVVRSGRHGMNILGIVDCIISSNLVLDNGQTLVAGGRAGVNIFDYIDVSLGSAAIAMTTGVVTTPTPTGLVVGDPIQFADLTGGAGMFPVTTYWVYQIQSSTTFLVAQTSALSSAKIPTTNGTSTSISKAPYCQRIIVSCNIIHNSGTNTTQDHGLNVSGRTNRINVVGNMIVNGITSDYLNGASATLLTRMGNVGLSTTGSGEGSNTAFYMAPGSYIGGRTDIGLTIMNDPTYKLAFWSKTPVVQPIAPPADATDLATAIALVNDLKTKLRTIGLMA